MSPLKLKIGELALEKGFVRKDVVMFAWDGIRDCSVEQCPVVAMCGYLKRGKCAVQVKYLDTLYNSILGTYKYLDEAMLFKIGMQIVPLYVQLMKMQIVELSLESPMMVTEKGGLVVHPIYREIRSTLVAINGLWKDLDLTFAFSGKPNPTVSGGSSSDLPGDNEKGDPGYYKTITSNPVSMKGIIR